MGGTPAVAVDADGDAIAVWRVMRSPLPRFSHSGYVESAVYDATPPELRVPQIPAAGKVGAKLRFSVTAADAWSGIASIRWSFGDGSKSSGRAVAHAYRRPGRYRVTVTATDEAGNEKMLAATLIVRRI